ncbi:hypothetical protein IAT38_000247 [Cryptococcus sp. DSM 104549]
MSSTIKSMLIPPHSIHTLWNPPMIEDTYSQHCDVLTYSPSPQDTVRGTPSASYVVTHYDLDTAWTKSGYLSRSAAPAIDRATHTGDSLEASEDEVAAFLRANSMADAIQKGLSYPDYKGSEDGSVKRKMQEEEIELWTKLSKDPAYEGVGLVITEEDPELLTLRQLAGEEEEPSQAKSSGRLRRWWDKVTSIRTD